MYCILCSDPQKDVDLLKEEGGTIVVGTPGRIDDVFNRCSFLCLKTVEILVLDEADRLLDMGFQRQIDSVMNKLPRQRRTGLFSATQTDAVKALARAGLRNPVRIAVAVEYLKRTANDPEAAATMEHRLTPSTLHVHYAVIPCQEKLSSLINFLNAHKDKKIIVYFLTCACVDYFSLALEVLAKEASVQGCNRVISKRGFHALHGRMKQAARESALAAFSEAEAGIMLATDVAARGLDIPDVHWVIQYDAPQDPASFVHRCGRTARMGKSGDALVFLTPEEDSYVEFLELRKIPVRKLDIQRGVLDASTSLRALKVAAEGDRLLMETGIRAFVSYIRAYKEHICKYIFRLNCLPMGWLASSFAVLRLPKMREVKKAARAAKAGNLEGFAESSVDTDSIPFKDQTRENQRQASIQNKRASCKPSSQGLMENTMKNDSLSAAKQMQTSKPVPHVRLTAAKRRMLETRQELAELHDDYALLRKLKKGKITQAEYDASTDIDDLLGGGNELLDAAVRKKTKKKRKKNKRHNT